MLVRELHFVGCQQNLDALRLCPLHFNVENGTFFVQQRS